VLRRRIELIVIIRRKLFIGRQLLLLLLGRRIELIVIRRKLFIGRQLLLLLLGRRIELIVIRRKLVFARQLLFVLGRRIELVRRIQLVLGTLELVRGRTL
ncbi:MAG TPA: hypothetical protein VIG42_03020, partial [Solirubrobacteraceae bacterium]